MGISVCKSCKAEIRWAVTEGGNWIPVDAKPNSVGNLTLLERGTEPPLAVYQDVKAQQEHREAGRDLYLVHFSLCPNAKRHRRP